MNYIFLALDIALGIFCIKLLQVQIAPVAWKFIWYSILISSAVLAVLRLGSILGLNGLLIVISHANDISTGIHESLDFLLVVVLNGIFKQRIIGAYTHSRSKDGSPNGERQRGSNSEQTAKSRMGQSINR